MAGRENPLWVSDQVKLQAPLRPLRDFGWWLRDPGRQEGFKKGSMEMAWSSDRGCFPPRRGNESGVTWQDKRPTGWGPVFGHISGQSPATGEFHWFLPIFLGAPNVRDGWRSLSSSFPVSQIGCSRHSQSVTLMPWDTSGCLCAIFPSLLWLWCARSLYSPSQPRVWPDPLRFFLNTNQRFNRNTSSTGKLRTT